MDPEKLIKTEEVPLEFEMKGVKYYGVATPLSTSCLENECFELNVTLNEKAIGSIYCDKNFKCSMREVFDTELVEKIGREIMLWYNM